MRLGLCAFLSSDSETKAEGTFDQSATAVSLQRSIVDLFKETAHDTQGQAYHGAALRSRTTPWGAR